MAAADDPLRRVKRAAAGRARAETEYRQAMIDARHAGCSLAQVAAAAGITRAGVRYFTNAKPD